MAQSAAARRSIGDRAEALYDARIKQNHSDAELGKFLAIEVNTGDFEVGDDALSAMDALHERNADAEVFLMKHGSRYAYTLGFAGTYGILGVDPNDLMNDVELVDGVLHYRIFKPGGTK